MLDFQTFFFIKKKKKKKKKEISPGFPSFLFLFFNNNFFWFPTWISRNLKKQKQKQTNNQHMHHNSVEEKINENVSSVWIDKITYGIPDFLSIKHWHQWVAPVGTIYVEWPNRLE